MTARAPAAASATGPFSRFELLIAGRYLRARRKDAFISVIASLTMVGIALGVATLIVVMSVMGGFRAELLSKLLGLNGHFVVYPIERQFTDYNETAAEIETVQGVTAAIPFVEGQALASGLSTESTGVSVRGMDAAGIKKLGLLYDRATLGGWDQWDGSEGVAIGERLAQKLGVTIGDPVTIVNPNGTTTPFGKTPQIRSYPVNVIFNLGMVEFDSFFLFMPMEPAQTYFRMYTDQLKPGVAPPGVMATDEEIEAAYERVPQATAVEIFVQNPDDIVTMRNRLQADIRPSILSDWQQRNETFFSALQVERAVMFVILSAIILVAAFNILSSLVMLVKDKAKDIAILRTMGATRGAIMRIFSLTGTMIGFAGTVVGLVLGLAVAMNAETLRAFLSEVIGVRIFPPEIFFLSELPSKVSPGEVITVVALALGLSVLATIYPAWRAAQYDPVEALRYE